MRMFFKKSKPSPKNVQDVTLLHHPVCNLISPTSAALFQDHDN
jgi:hypothetical protein